MAGASTGSEEGALHPAAIMGELKANDVAPACSERLRKSLLDWFFMKPLVLGVADD